jgi:hypothetical protein
LKNKFLGLAGVLAALLTASAAFADTSADPVQIGTYGGKNGWSAYHFHDRAGEVCFMSHMPDKQEGKFKKRGPVLFFVTHWSGGKDASVVSVLNGYEFKSKSTATLAVKGKKFNLLTQGDKGWTKDQDEDSAVIKEMLAGSTMTIKGTSSRDTNTSDTYALKGAGDAWKAVLKECADKK